MAVCLDLKEECITLYNLGLARMNLALLATALRWNCNWLWRTPDFFPLFPALGRSIEAEQMIMYSDRENFDYILHDNILFYHICDIV